MIGNDVDVEESAALVARRLYIGNMKSMANMWLRRLDVKLKQGRRGGWYVELCELKSALEEFISLIDLLHRKLRCQQDVESALKEVKLSFDIIGTQWSLAMKKELRSSHAESSMFTARSGDSAVVMHDSDSREVVRSIGSNGSVSSFNAEGGRLAAVMPTGMSAVDRDLVLDIIPDGANNRTGSAAPKAVVYGDHSRAVSQVAGTMNVANMELHVTSQELEPRCCGVS